MQYLKFNKRIIKKSELLKEWLNLTTSYDCIHYRLEDDQILAYIEFEKLVRDFNSTLVFQAYSQYIYEQYLIALEKTQLLD